MGFPAPPLASPLPPYWSGGGGLCVRGVRRWGREAEVRTPREESVILFELCNARIVVKIR